jgi:uncharacterized protein (TIGR02996 family)
MNDDTALLLHLEDNPDDDATLLVYADWLDDQGEARRAEFLRLQQRVLQLRHRQRGFSDQSRQLFRLGRSLEPAWLAIVSRPRLAGTCWAGTGLSGQHYVWRYLAGGVLNYTSPSGTWQNGTWLQVGNHVAMETNRHYADYDGLIGGDEIRGKAENITGLRWRWWVRRTTAPEECDVGEPELTVFDSHLLERRRRRRRAGFPA